MKQKECNIQSQEACKETVLAVNSLLLLFYEQITGFWKQLFLGCTGFVALVVPIAVNAEMPSNVKKLLLCSVVAATLAASGLIYPLVKGAINIKKIHEEGRRILVNHSQMKDYAMPYCTKSISISIVVFGVLFFCALTLLCVALYSTII